MLVLDLNMPGTERLDVLRERQGRAARAQGDRADACTPGREYVARAMQGGADAYLLKDSAVQDLVAAVEAVPAGRTYFSPPIQQQHGRAAARRHAGAGAGTTLTEREREVLGWLARGLSSKAVAAASSTSASARSRRIAPT